MATGTIAVVDPDAAFNDQLTVLLQGAGYATRSFTTLAGTYDAIRANPPDALIVELHFPESKHGIDLVTLLKLRQETRTLPVIMTSADVPFLLASGERLRERAVPAVWTLPKPFDQAEVLRLLQQVLNQSGLAREVHA